MRLDYLEDREIRRTLHRNHVTRTSHGAQTQIQRFHPSARNHQIARRKVAAVRDRYNERYKYRRSEETGSILVMTADGKGVVMRWEDLREVTRKRTEQSRHKMVHRLSPGEKPNKQRMGTVAVVYTIAPYGRSAEEVLRCLVTRRGLLLC